MSDQLHRTDRRIPKASAKLITITTSDLYIRSNYQEVMHVQKMCNARNRGIDRGQVGSTLSDPNIDFAKVAQGPGVYAEGPITNPKDLGPALARAIAVVKRGEPALVDVVTQVR